MAQRLTASAKLRRVRSLKRRLREAERAYAAALEADQAERRRRTEARMAHLAAMDARKRARIVARAEKKRTKKSAWWERARVRMLYPLIGE